MVYFVLDHLFLMVFAMGYLFWRYQLARFRHDPNGLVGALMKGNDCLFMDFYVDLRRMPSRFLKDLEIHTNGTFLQKEQESFVLTIRVQYSRTLVRRQVLTKQSFGVV